MNTTKIESSSQEIDSGNTASSQGGASKGFEDENHASLSKDLVFELLKNERRRRVLKILEKQNETTLSTLAEEIAAKENGTEKRLLSSSQRKRVYIALYQCHLPKLDDAGVVEFEQARGTVEMIDRADQLFSYLYLDGNDNKPDERSFSSLVRKTVDWIR